MLTDGFAFARGDDAAPRLDGAASEGTDASLSATEPVGTVGGRPAPAPAAPSPTSSHPDQVQPDHIQPDHIQFGEFGPGDDAMRQFLDDYLELLDGRLKAIRRCLDDSDIEGARVAVLSLESSSAMLGGTALTARLAELRAHLDLGSTPQRLALVSSVEATAARFRHELSDR